MSYLSNHPTLSRATLAATAAVLAVSLTGCGTDDPDTPAIPTFTTVVPVPSSTAPAQVGDGTGLATVAYVDLDKTVFPTTDTDNAFSVLTDGLTTAFSWAPADDSNGWAAILRSSTAWNNQYLAAQEMRLTTLVPMSSRDWQTWGERGQRFTAAVTVTNEDHPTDTDLDVARVVKIVLSTTGGTVPEANREILTLIATTRMHKADVGWRIDSFDVKDTILPEVTPS